MIAMKEGAGRKREVNKLVEDMKQTLMQNNLPYLQRLSII
jgi:hypothetical protein